MGLLTRFRRLSFCFREVVLTHLSYLVEHSSVHADFLAVFSFG